MTLEISWGPVGLMESGAVAYMDIRPSCEVKVLGGFTSLSH